MLSFIVVFGVTWYLAGRLADRFGRKHILVGGWFVAALTCGSGLVVAVRMRETLRRLAT